MPYLDTFVNPQAMFIVVGPMIIVELMIQYIGNIHAALSSVPSVCVLSWEVQQSWKSLLPIKFIGIVIVKSECNILCACTDVVVALSFCTAHKRDGSGRQQMKLLVQVFTALSLMFQSIFPIKRKSFLGNHRYANIAAPYNSHCHLSRCVTVSYA